MCIDGNTRMFVIYKSTKRHPKTSDDYEKKPLSIGKNQKSVEKFKKKVLKPIKTSALL